MDLKDRLIREHIEDETEFKYAETHIGFDPLTLKEARKALRDAKKWEKRSGEDLDILVEELSEIFDDLEFDSDPKNKIIKWVNDNCKELENKVLSKFKVEDLMIRAHVDKEYLCIMGKSVGSVDGIEEFVQEQSGFKAINMLFISGQ